MDSSALGQSTPDRYAQIASPFHTILVLLVTGAWAFWFKILADRLSIEPNPNRVSFYLLGILLEWFVFALVLAGVRYSGGSVLLVLGDRWRSGLQVLRDLGIAAGFWIIAVALLTLFSRLLHITSNPKVLFLIPRTGPERTLWVLLAISAGICEETIFRGYLQRQFIALLKNAPAGILLSAAFFGVGHAYQGSRMVILISLYGAMFGILAYWRRSVRPGMIAHAWQDTLSGLAASLSMMRH